MLGVIVNTCSIFVGSIIGLLFRRAVSEKISTVTMKVMGLVTFYVGIKGALVGENTIVIIISLVVGTIIGTAIDIDKYINLLGEFLKKNFTKKSSSRNENFVDAFVTSSVLFGVGAMAVMGSIEAGIEHKYTIFFVKSTLDFMSSIMCAASMGVGVFFSGFVIFILQGSLTLLASSLKFIADNQSLMNEISCVGNIIIVAISFNLICETKLKIANMLPAIILTPVVFYIAALIK